MSHTSGPQTGSRPARPVCIGLTGGIGSGKSLASAEFERLGIRVIDTDTIARELVAAGQPALAEIAAQFGADVLTPTGTLDRGRLRERIFANPTERYTLEDILHPRIRAVVTARVERCETPYCVIVIPLLAENAQDYALDRVLVIDCPEDLQRRRVAARDGLDEAAIDAVMAAQANRETRLKIADDIIVNDRDPAHLRAAIERLHRRYLALASDSQATKSG